MHLNLYLKGTKWWKHFKSKCCAMWTICLILSLFLTITTQITDNQLNESRFSTNATEFNTNPVETRSNKQESPSRKWKLTWKIAGIIFLISLSVLFSGIFQFYSLYHNQTALLKYLSVPDYSSINIDEIFLKKNQINLIDFSILQH